LEELQSTPKIEALIEITQASSPFYIREACWTPCRSRSRRCVIDRTISMVERIPTGESVAKFEFFGDGLIAREVRIVEVIQQTAALAHHHEQTTARAMVFDIALQMLGQMIYPLRQQSHLHVGRSGVFLMQPEARYRLSFIHTFIDQSLL
jgi:hypothetical protein